MFFVPIPKKIAKERGLNRYFTGNTCKRGNVAPRAVSDAKCMCIACKKALREVKREYNNTEHGKLLKKKHAQKSYITNKESINKKNREYRLQPENKERKLILDRNWRKNNPLACMKSYRKFSLKHPEKIKSWRKKWNSKNRPKKSQYAISRRLVVKNAQFHTELTEFVFNQAHELAKQREILLGILIHVDHMIPLQNPDVCGLHTWNNFQCLPQVMNNSKSNKLIYTNPHEWLYDIPKFFKVVYQKEIAS